MIIILPQEPVTVRIIKSLRYRTLQVRQRLQARDVLLPSRQKRPLRHRISIVVPMYNVAMYVQRFLQSLDDQTANIDDAEIVIVDDGSTDRTGEIAKAWCARRKNARYIYQDNQGAAAARNRGLQEVTGDWVTFPDPDDYLARRYLSIVDRELGKPRNRNLAVVSCRPVILDDATGKIRNSHPARYRFSRKNRRRVQLSKLGDDLQFQIGPAFIRRSLLEKHQLRFDPRVRPTFEDGHLFYRLFIREPDLDILFCGPAVYFYRKRGDSLVGSARTKPEWYVEQLRFGYLSLLEEACKLVGHAPAYLQQAILYDLKARFTHLTAHPRAGDFLSYEQQLSFKSLVAEIMRHIDAKVLADGNISGLWHEDRVALLARYHEQSQPPARVYVRLVDWPHRQIQLAYYSASGPAKLQFQLGGKKADLCPSFPSSSSKTLLGEPYVTEHRFWVSVPDNSAISATLDGAPVNFVIPGDRTTTEVTLAQLKKRPWPLGLLNLIVPPGYRNCWLFMDRLGKADDNAEHLYRHIRAVTPGRTLFFVLDRNSADWERLQNDGFQLIPYRSVRHYLAHLGSRLLVSSHADHPIVHPFPGRRGNNPAREFVFLQHGVTDHDISRWLNSKPIRLMITATEAEYRSIASPTSNYLLCEKNLVRTGFPRHDALLGRAKDKPSLLLVMPTWRRHFSGPRHSESMDDFSSSNYAKHWNELLHSRRLQMLARDGQLQVVFCAHPNMSIYLHEWHLPSWIKKTSALHEPSIQPLLVDTALLVTDYSSIAFEAAYLDRPVVYFQFDRPEFNSGKHLYDPGYFDFQAHGFGPVADTSDQVLDSVEASLLGREPAEYAGRRRQAFAFRDGLCCNRVYTALTELVGDDRAP